MHSGKKQTKTFEKELNRIGEREMAEGLLYKCEVAGSIPGTV